MSTVLTIDDSRVVRTMVGRQLQPYGCTVIEAQNGLEGLEAARTHRPDLILLDVTMPVMDGRECLAELRKDERCRDIPVIMLTAESGRDIVLELAKLRVSGYVVKPFQPETFDAAVGKVLGKAGASAAPATGGEPDPAIVLVVDDSARILEAARTALEGSLTVLTALSGAAAVEQYKQRRPGLVVVDLAMPDMDGFATLEALRPLGNSSFVALSLRGEAALQEQAKKAGFRAVIEKPFQGAELLEKLRGLGAGKADVLTQYVSEHGGFPVMQLPDVAASSKVTPLLLKKLRALAEDGSDKFIVDLGDLRDIGGEQMTVLARLLAESATLGLRAAICAPSPDVVGKLKQIAETQNAPCAATRDEAAGSLT